VYYRQSTQPDVIAVPIGAFADPAFSPPTVFVYEARRRIRLSTTTAREEGEHGETRGSPREAKRRRRSRRASVRGGGTRTPGLRFGDPRLSA
jgi:hypothetical protein